MRILNEEKRVYLISFISSMTLFYAPIIFLFYKNFEINIFQIGIIFSINSITTILFEIPFGLFSDKYSSKLSVLIGYFLSIIGIIFLLISKDYYQFIIANILLSIGEAGMSGASTVLLMSYLKRSDDIFDIGAITKGVANIVGGLLIGITYNYNIRFPFLIAFILYVWNFINYLNIKEEKKIKEEIEESNDKENVGLLNKGVFKTIKSNIFILSLLLFCYISIPQIMIYFPEYLTINNIDAKYVGIMYMVANIFSLIGSKIHKKYMGNIENLKKLKSSIFFIMILSLMLALVKNIWIGIIFYLLFRIIMGWFYQLFYRYINNNSPTEHKSTMFSIISVVMEISFIISDPIITWIIYSYNIYMTYIFASIFTLMILIILMIIEKNKKA